MGREALEVEQHLIILLVKPPPRRRSASSRDRHGF
jgi:hypothetical protein